MFGKNCQLYYLLFQRLLALMHDSQPLDDLLTEKDEGHVKM